MVGVGRLRADSADIRLSRKFLSATNTLAYIKDKRFHAIVPAVSNILTRSKTVSKSKKKKTIIFKILVFIKVRLSQSRKS